MTEIKVTGVNFKFALEELYLSNSSVKAADFDLMPHLRVLFVDGSALRAVRLNHNSQLARLRYNTD